MITNRQQVSPFRYRSWWSQKSRLLSVTRFVEAVVIGLQHVDEIGQRFFFRNFPRSEVVAHHLSNIRRPESKTNVWSYEIFGKIVHDRAQLIVTKLSSCFTIIEIDCNFNKAKTSCTKR